MTEYYFDIETSGLCPNFDKIITIQYQELDRETAKPLGDLTILKEWESSEKNILERFLDFSKLHGSTKKHDYTFIPIGDNLLFDLLFLQQRVKLLLNFEIPTWLLLQEKRKIDIRSILVLINHSQFYGSGIDQVIYNRQRKNPQEILGWYPKKEYAKIIDYVRLEAKDFIEFYQTLRQKLPTLIQTTRKKNNAV